MVIILPEYKIVYESLPPDQKDLCDCIGMDAYERIVTQYSGQSLYIPKIESVTRSSRDEKIRSDFNGYNYKYLAMKYGLSERTIRMITSDILQEKKNAPLDGQITFDDF
ncbi:MAG: Mor transcription activator family protein [Oscillospiraceae bacterium]